MCPKCRVLLERFTNLHKTWKACPQCGLHQEVTR